VPGNANTFERLPQDTSNALVSFFGFASASVPGSAVTFERLSRDMSINRLEVFFYSPRLLCPATMFRLKGCPGLFLKHV
jgi:hypothetical protein